MTSHLYSLLVVDDNEMNRDLLTRRLERKGYQVTAAVDGLQALEILDQADFDLILLDIMLPLMNGYQVLEHLKADESLSQVPVIIATSLDEADGKARCMALGAADYITKPFNPVMLKSRISDCLARHQLPPSLS